MERTKPQPDPLYAAMCKGGLDPDGTIMVGDTVWDVEASKNAGLPCTGVRTGGWSDARLRTAGAATVYDDAATLLEDFASSPLGRLASRG